MLIVTCTSVAASQHPVRQNHRFVDFISFACIKNLLSV